MQVARFPHPVFLRFIVRHLLLFAVVNHHSYCGKPILRTSAA